MHLFMLNIPRLDMAAVIPKGDYLTVCLLGQDIDRDLITAFFASPAVRRCSPPGTDPQQGACHCSPKITIRAAALPFADRIVLVGDCGVTRLYKDGIGAAYRTAKAAARTAVFSGVAAGDFRRHYWPTYRAIARDNGFGADLRCRPPAQSHRALPAWDPADGGAGAGGTRGSQTDEHGPVGHVHRERPLRGSLLPDARSPLSGRYADGQIICRQGEPGQCMYVSRPAGWRS